MEHIVVFVTTANREEAEKIGKTLVEEKLAACANIVSDIQSVYWWKGIVESAGEVFVMLKTRKSLFPRVAARVKELHSYEVPEVIALPIVTGSEEYLAWIEDSTVK